MKLRWFLLIILLLLLAFISLGIGPSGFSFKEIAIPLKIRLPRVLCGVFAGGVLAFAGGALQGLLQNPLVDPYILGVASGATFGASIALVLGVGSTFTLPLFSFLGALLTMVLVFGLSRIQGRVSRSGMILAGVIMSFFFSSLVMIVMVFSKKPLSQIIYLLMGNLGIVFSSKTLALFIVSAVISITVLVIIYGSSRSLNILSSNEEVAESLGVNTNRLTKEIFIFTSLVVGLVVAFTGAIGFVGLMIPHIVRLLFGPDHSKLLPASFLLGASFLLFSDLIARTITPVELPISVVTALFGVPFFIYLLKTRL